MERLHNMICTVDEETGGVDIAFPEYPGLTAHAEPGEDVAKVGYEAFQNAPARIKKESICPACGQKYNGYPAASRKDGITEICPDCGMREAFATFGYEPEQIEESIAEIHRLQAANA